MKNILIIYCLFVSLDCYSQFETIDKLEELRKLESIEWKVSVYYLPSPKGKVELIQLSNDIIKHSSHELIQQIEKTGSSRNLNEIQKNEFRNAVTDYLLISNDSIIPIYLSNEIKEEFSNYLNKSEFYPKEYNLNLEIVKKYLSKDTICINTQVFRNKINGYWLMTVDGTAFVSSLRVRNKKGDSYHELKGNLEGGFFDENAKEFLIQYLICNKYNLFEFIGLKGYLSNRTLLNVILRYISYKENLYISQEFEEFEKR